MSKTNFEAWRDSLTPEDLLDENGEDLGLVSCAICPTKSNCTLQGRNCKDEFLRWANAPAKEEETK